VQHFDGRMKEFSEQLDKLRRALAEIGRQLIQMESKYAITEDINKDDIYRLYGLIDSVEAFYPGAKSILPAPPGGFPEVPPPKEPPAK
jgi:cob(I)alamin adenosyltransferase